MIGNAKKKTGPGVSTGARLELVHVRLALLAISKQRQQHQEHVDEVQIEAQCAHDGLAAGDRAVISDIVHLLDALGVVSREAGRTPARRSRKWRIAAPTTARKMFTSIAMMTPIRPMMRNEPHPDRSFFVV